MKRLLILCLCAALPACSSSQEPSEPASPSQEAGVHDAAFEAPATDAAPEDSSPTDASPEEAAPAEASPQDAPSADSPNEGGSSFETCENTCAQTNLLITLGGKKGTLDRAQFGFNANQTLHLEAHFGGAPACPTQSSPAPDRTVVFANVPIPTDLTPIENTPVTLLDFKGDLSPNPMDKATKAKLTPVAASASPPSGGFVAFEVEVTFPNGTMTGHLYATHCDTMDE
jgi:hypothetical protein